MPFELGGLIVPLVTPLLENEDIDVEAIPRLLSLHEDSGTAGLFLLGTCGEGPCLSDSAKIEMLDATLEHLAVEGNGGLPILVGVAETATRRAVQWARRAYRPGVSALVVVLPTFHGIATIDEAVGHVQAVADGVGGPVVLYNSPTKTGGVSVELEAITKLLADGTVIGIKDSSGDLEYLGELLELRDVFPEFRVMNGELRCAAEALRMGVDGLVVSYGNVEPDKCRELIEAAGNGDYEKAGDLQKRFVDTWKAFADYASPAARVKSILAARGICRPVCCGPAARIDPMIPDTLRDLGAFAEESKWFVHE